MVPGLLLLTLAFLAAAWAFVRRFARTRDLMDLSMALAMAAGLLALLLTVQALP
jgi:hypothetical protein